MMVSFTMLPLLFLNFHCQRQKGDVVYVYQYLGLFLKKYVWEILSIQMVSGEGDYAARVVWDVIDVVICMTCVFAVKLGLHCNPL